MSDIKTMNKVLNSVLGLTVECGVCKGPMKVSSLFIVEDHVSIEYSDKLHRFTEEYEIIRGMEGAVTCRPRY